MPRTERAPISGCNRIAPDCRCQHGEGDAPYIAPARPDLLLMNARHARTEATFPPTASATPCTGTVFATLTSQLVFSVHDSPWMGVQIAHSRAVFALPTFVVAFVPDCKPSSDNRHPPLGVCMRLSHVQKPQYRPRLRSSLVRIPKCWRRVRCSRQIARLSTGSFTYDYQPYCNSETQHVSRTPRS